LPPDLAPSEPQQDQHQCQDVGKAGDGGPRQLDVSALPLGEQRPERGEQRPQHHDGARQGERGGVDHAEAGEEHHLGGAHAVAHVVGPVDGRGSEHARQVAPALPARTRSSPRWCAAGVSNGYPASARLAWEPDSAGSGQ